MTGGLVMRMTSKATIMAGVLAVGGLLAATSPAHAGCGGGSGYRGGYGGHSFSRANPAGNCCGSGCNMGGMAMSGMAMPAASMPMAGTSMPPASMQGMNMGGNTTPAAAPVATVAPPSTAATAGSQYYCPMHPSVVSAGPATCPYCQMALKRR